MKIIREVCCAGAVIDVTVKQTQKQMSVRAPKRKPSREAVIKNNERIATKKLARVVNANFVPGDYHATLTHAKVMPASAAKKELDNFLRRLKREYRKMGKELKFVVATEYENHRIHHHMILNYVPAEIITKQWKAGHVKLSVLDQSRNYTRLAEYLIKETRKTFRKAGNMTKCRYRCSRNMEQPVVVRQEVKLTSIMEEPKAFKGYVLDEDSVRRFENPCTHIPHLEYVMVSNEPVPRLKKWRNGTVVKKHESFLRSEELTQLEMQDYEFWGTL